MGNIVQTTVKNDRLERSQQICEIDFFFTVATGVVTVRSPGNFAPIIYGTSATPFTQTAIDTLLGSPDQIVATTAFGSTAMGVDAFGMVIDLDGQADELVAVWRAETASAGAWQYPSGSAMPNTLTEACYLTAEGNIALRVIITGLDSSNDPIWVKVYYRPKTYA